MTSFLSTSFFPRVFFIFNVLLSRKVLVVYVYVYVYVCMYVCVCSQTQTFNEDFNRIQEHVCSHLETFEPCLIKLQYPLSNGSINYKAISKLYFTH